MEIILLSQLSALKWNYLGEQMGGMKKFYKRCQHPISSRWKIKKK